MLAAAAASSLRAAARKPVPALARGFAVSAMARADDASTPKSGSTATSKAFSQKEKSEEQRYILEREREKYKLAQQELAKQKKELDELESKHK